MDNYTTDKKNLNKIRSMFSGYIFRRVDQQGVGHVKCSIKQAKRIESNGIVLKLEKNG